ncbi:hypothetical protein EU527_06220 [Candidatus Thorarchaeota archaeon]|nr:MAG: hypothetical protein EU527_06220 [Candidatus Thorarchaeota archaeon]
MEIVFDDRGMIIRSDNNSVLIISDMHLGLEEEISEEKGVHFPFQHVNILERVKTIVSKYDVSKLYIIGDVKHTILTDIPYNWEILPEFMTELNNIVKTIIIPGNHDGDLEALLPRSVTVKDVRGIIIGEGNDRVGLLHGHSWPDPKLLDVPRIVIGHSHPSVSRFRVVSSPKLGRTERKRFAGSIPVIIQSQLNKNCVRQQMGLLEIDGDEGAILVTLPSFNQLISGLAINSPHSEMQGPFFENSCASLIDSEVFSTDGLFLGTVGWMRERFNEMIKSNPTGN